MRPIVPSPIRLLLLVAALTPGAKHLAAQFGGPCETWISITSSPASPTQQATASIWVEWGDIQTEEPVCLEGGASNFQFTVNGVNRTGDFSVGWNSANGTVPLEVGWNDLVASIDGYDRSGNPQTQFDSRLVERTAVYGVAVTPDGGSVTTPSNSNSSVSFDIQNTGNTSNTFSFTCGYTGAVTNCGYPVPVSLEPGQVVSRSVPYWTGGPGSGTVTLTATGTGTSDGGSYTVTVPIVYGVTLTPDGGTASAILGTADNELTFTVTNTGNSTDSFTFSCVRSGAVASCSPPASVPLAAQASTPVTANYDASSSPGSGSVTVTATSQGNGSVTDPGSYNVTVVLPQVAPVPSLVNHNGDNQDRALCLTAAAGEGAAVQCGDLLVSHAMPVFRSLSKDRALTLVYNSATAEPRPRVAAHVQISSGAEEPQNIYAELRVGGTVRASATYASWAPGGTRQIVLSFDASDLSTGLYPFTLETRSVYSSGSYGASLSDTLIIVNRVESEFGAGWYLAGVERLFVGQPGSKILWVGGDGSAKVYRDLGSGQWQGPVGAFRDVIVLNGTTYERQAKHGVRVRFDGAGRHIETENRLEHLTTFVWDANGRLVEITAPGTGGGG